MRKHTLCTYNGYAGAANPYTARSIADSILSGGTYRSADSFDSAENSSSMLYKHERYAPRVPGVSITTQSHSYGPPGVDAASTVTSLASDFVDLKRSSSESLYHLTLLNANAIGHSDIWYSTNQLTKRPRYENSSHLPIYPQRPGERDCAYYMRTRTCKFGDSCIFDHPIWVPEGGIPDWKEVPLLPNEDLPERPGAPDCPYFMKTQRCKFGNRCKFNHPKDITVLGASVNDDSSVLPERPSEPPCAFYMKTGQCKFGSTCKFHHPRGVQIQPAEAGNGNSVATPVQLDFAPALMQNSKGLPIRSGVGDCPFYLKTGSCKYGATCRYNHPNRIAFDQPTAAIVPSLLSSVSAPFNMGVASVTCLLPTFDPMLTQTAVGLTHVYPQRPGQTESDYGDSCKFHHPIDRSAPTSSRESQQLNVKLTLAGLRRREGAIHCPFYMKTGMCKYGATCKFDHPLNREVATSQGPLNSMSGEGKDNGENAS